jgi:Tfp pilus assembly protein PilP
MMSAQRLAASLAFVLVLTGTGLADQQPKARTPQAQPPVAKAPARVLPPPAVPEPVFGYSYRSEGRRDPFQTLIARGSDGRSSGRRAEGLAGLGVNEIVLRGILRTRGTYVAMVQGPDLKTYIVHPNDRLLDGTVRAITADSLVILQEVNDPLSLTKQREVRKTLRAVEEVK